MSTDKQKEYSKKYYNLHKEEILKKKNRGIRVKRELNTGEKFERLTIINFFGKDKRGNFCYLCKCNCGNEKVVRKTDLLGGLVKSCGCLRSEISRSIGKKFIHCAFDANFKGMGDLPGHYLSEVKKNAKTRNIEYNVSVDYLWNLYLSQNKKCALSGIEIKFGNRYKKLTITASLDRINSSLGYIEGNVQWVHKTLNIMKRQLNNQEFLDWCKTVVNYNENKSITIVQ